MMKKQKELHTVPFFWTTMLGRSIHYAGRMGQRERKERNHHQAKEKLRATCSPAPLGQLSSARASLPACSPMPESHPLSFFLHSRGH